MRTKLSLFLVLLSAGAFAQSNTDQHTLTITIPSVALLDLEPSAGKNISASFTAPADPGLPLVAPAAVTSVWLNYTSVLPASGITERNVTVSMTGSLAGIEITVQAGTASATGDGTKGAPVASALVLGGSEQNIIQGIGSAYTGTGANNGHQLTYNVNLVSGSFDDLVSGNQVATIKYTLTAD